jgi:hypothetical protein
MLMHVLKAWTGCRATMCNVPGRTFVSESSAGGEVFICFESTSVLLTAEQRITGYLSAGCLSPRVCFWTLP